MNLHQILYFIEVCNCRSISMAARKLYTDKASISRSLTELEKELGVVCLERTTKGIALTKYGEIVYKAFASAQSTLDAMKTDIEELKRKELTYLDVFIAFGVMKSLSTQMWNSYLHKYEGEKKLLPVDLPARKVDRAVLERKAKIGFTVGPIDENLFDAELLKKEPVYLIISSKHPLFNEEHVDISERLGSRFFGYTDDFKLQKAFIKMCKARGFDASPHYISEDIHSLIQMSIENRGFFFVPECWCEFLRTDVKYVKLPQDEISWDVYVIKRKNEILPAALQEFWNHCIGYCQEKFSDTLNRI